LGAARDASPDIIVLISVGEITVPQLELLRRRTRRVFDEAVVIIGYWRNSRELLDHGQDDDMLIFAESVDAILRSARRIANERSHTQSSAAAQIGLVAGCPLLAKSVHALHLAHTTWTLRSPACSCLQASDCAERS
jgi:hypothetical protein